MQRPINVWNTHFRRLFLSVSNYIHIWIIFYNCYCGLKSLLFPTSTTMRSYNRIELRHEQGTNFTKELTWSRLFHNKIHNFFLHHQAENPSIFQYRTVAPNKVQVDIGHQHSCTFFIWCVEFFWHVLKVKGKIMNRVCALRAQALTREKNTNT